MWNVARARAWRRLFREIREGFSPCRNSRGKLRGRVVVSELPRDLRSESRGFRGIYVSFVVALVGRLESPRLAVVTRASRLAGRARRPDGGRASLPLLPWDGKDRVEGNSRSRISRWVELFELSLAKVGSSVRGPTRPRHGGSRRSATRSGRRRCSRQRPHPAQASRPRASRGWRGGLVRRRPRGRRGERTAG